MNRPHSKRVPFVRWKLCSYIFFLRASNIWNRLPGGYILEPYNVILFKSGGQSLANVHIPIIYISSLALLRPYNSILVMYLEWLMGLALCRILLEKDSYWRLCTKVGCVLWDIARSTSETGVCFATIDEFRGLSFWWLFLEICHNTLLWTSCTKHCHILVPTFSRIMHTERVLVLLTVLSQFAAEQAQLRYE